MEKDTAGHIDRWFIDDHPDLGKRVYRLERRQDVLALFCNNDPIPTAPNPLKLLEQLLLAEFGTTIAKVTVVQAVWPGANQGGDLHGLIGDLRTLLLDGRSSAFPKWRLVQSGTKNGLRFGGKEVPAQNLQEPSLAVEQKKAADPEHQSAEIESASRASINTLSQGADAADQRQRPFISSEEDPSKEGGAGLETRETLIHLDQPTINEPQRKELAAADVEPDDRPLGPAEKRAEEFVHEAAFELAHRRVLGLPSRSLLWAACIIVDLVLLWFFLPHRWTTLRYVTGSATLCAIILFVAVILNGLRKLHSTDKITIYVARLGGDKPGNDAQELVMLSIRNELRSIDAKIIDAKITLSASESDAEQSIIAAQRFLRKKNCDILIWGKVYTPSGMKDRLVLRFSVPDFDHRPTETFGFTPECSLESNFGSELGTAIAAVAASMVLPTVRNTGVFMSTILEPTADKLAKLVGDLGQTHAVDRGVVLQSYGLIQLTIGAKSGDGFRLKEAADALRSATNALSRKRVPFSWALSQNSLGTALMFLGNQKVGTDLLKEGVSAFEAALDEWTGDQVGAFRGVALHNLGVTLSQIGQRESGSEHLKKGIDVLRRALKTESGRRSAAHVQASLGAALTRLAEREADERCLEEAIELTRSSVDNFLHRFPSMALSWARGNIALATALRDLGEWKGRVELLEEAARALQSASKVMTRSRAPLQWVDIQIRLAATLIRQGELDESSMSALHESVSVIKHVLEEPLRDRYPHEWAKAQNTLGVASLRIGMREDNVAWLQAAETAFRNVLDPVSRDRVPAFWAVAKNGLASTLAVLGADEQDKSRLEEAIAYFHEAAEECAPQNDRMGWAFAQHDLAVALISLGVLFEVGTRSLEEAVRMLQAVLEEWTPESAPTIHKRIQSTLERALSMIRARSGTDDIPVEKDEHRV